MTDKPIIFSGPMVRALLEGRKFQTRRILKPQPMAAVAGFDRVFKEPPFFEARDAAGKPVERAFPYPKGFVSPYPRLAYAPGDRLYVREAHAWVSLKCWVFQADNRDLTEEREAGEVGKWRPSIHMPRWASRLTLTVTEVRVQRLQDISNEDAKAEGVLGECAFHVGNDDTYRAPFRDLWNSLHGPDAWDANPWVVAYSFTVQHGNIDQFGKA